MESREKVEAMFPAASNEVDYGLDIFSLPSSMFTCEQLRLLKLKTISDIRSMHAEKALRESFESKRKDDINPREKTEAVSPTTPKDIDYGLDVFSLPSSIFTREQLRLLKLKTISDIRSMHAEEALRESFESKKKEDVDKGLASGRF